MKIGASYPVTKVAGNPEDIRQFVKAIERLGRDITAHIDYVAYIKRTYDAG